MKPGNLLAWWTMIYLSSQIPAARGLIGYDCAGVTANLTTVSLLEVGECNIPQQEVNVTRTYIQLIQINEYSSITVRQCKVEIYRTVRRCGMFSHTLDVPNGEYGYVDSISRDMCLDMYHYGTMRIGKTEISGITPNQTVTRPILITGALDNDGKCEGGTYSDPYGTWDSVVVQGSIKISLRDYTAQVNVNTDKVHLRSGTSCDLSEGRCVDFDGGDTFWDPIPEDSCKTGRYGLLYEGIADRITDFDIGNLQNVYALTEGDVTFGLTSKGNRKVCGFILTKTEHPKLLIVEIEKGNPFIARKPVEITNLDIFTYMNSKFVFVEKHIRTQIKDMYRDVLMQRCNLERQIIQTTLTIARISPDEFAFDLMKGPGYMALIAGEVAHIAQCIPVEVKIMETTECYNELPVAVGNMSFHLAPRTHVLLKPGTEVSCHQLLAPTYLLDGQWYSFGPSAVPVVAPTVLKPLTQPTWHYVSPHSLAASGIYTQRELDELRDHLMFPAERPAILNSLARGITGQSTVPQGGSISNLLDEQTLHRIAESAWAKTWGYLMGFGNISAGLIGILIICRGIKLIIDTVIHGYALHTVYGWSLYLLGAIWDSVTNLLLHLSKKPPGSGNSGNNEPAKDNENEATEPLNPPTNIVVSAPPESLEKFPFEPMKFDFDPRIRDFQEIMRQTGSSFCTLPHPRKKEETVPMRVRTRPDAGYLGEHVEITKRANTVYDIPPKPRPVSMTNLSTACLETIDEKPATNTLYPDLQSDSEETVDTANSRNKQPYFLLRKHPKLDEKK